jgi:hypothetical protein
MAPTGSTRTSKRREGEEGGDAGAVTAQFGPRLIIAVVLGLAGCYCSFVDPHLGPQVRRAAFHNQGADLRGEFLHGMIFTAACLGLVGLFDLCVARLFKGRWFAVHTVVNGAIVGMTAQQAFALFFMKNPYESCTCVKDDVPCAAHAPLCLSLGLHLWHGLAYPLKPIDWVHHLPNWGFTTAVIYYSWGPMQGFSLFWALMGVPGFIDYALLVAVKQRWLSARVEKDWNQTLNVWLRCPFCCICAFLLIGSVLTSPELFVDKGQMVVQTLNGVHAAWNGCFFMYRTVDARTRYVMGQKAQKLNEANTVPVATGTMDAPLLIQQETPTATTPYPVRAP